MLHTGYIIEGDSNRPFGSIRTFSDFCHKRILLKNLSESNFRGIHKI